jgi:uncharacterized protein (TIGR03067 family)
MSRRNLYVFCVLLLVAAGLGSDSPRGYDDATERNELEGVWQVVGNEYEDGQKVPFNGNGVQRFRNGKWTYHLGGSFLYEGFYKAVNGPQPAALDETDTVGDYKGRTRKFMYRIDGATMRMAFFRNEPLKRPTSVDDAGTFVIVFKRIGR